MTNITTKPDSSQPAAEMAVDLFDNWFDPIETEVRARAHEFIEELSRGELDAVLARPRYGRSQMAGKEESAGVAGHRHGSRTRSLTGTFGPIEIAVPRARLDDAEGKTTEWKSGALRAYQRRTLAADALIAGSYLAGTNTRRVRRALAALFGGTVGKDTVSRTWRKVKSDWDALNSRSLAEEPARSVPSSVRGLSRHLDKAAGTARAADACAGARRWRLRWISSNRFMRHPRS